MFKLFHEEDENKFTWDSIGDVIDGRRHLGEEMPVYLATTSQIQGTYLVAQEGGMVYRLNRNTNQVSQLV